MRSHRPHLLVVVATTLSLGLVAAVSSGATARSPQRAIIACNPAAVVAHWTPARLAATLLVAPVDQRELAAGDGVVAEGVGGLLLYGTPPSGLGSALKALVGFAPKGTTPLVMTDEEGGAVQRLSPLIANLPAARTLGARESPAAIRAGAFALARQMRSLGVTMDLGPVADVDGGVGPNATNADGTRSFSADPVTVSNDALAFAEGLAAGGVIPVVKHFPGLGGASANTDLAVAHTLPWAQLQRQGIPPFVAAIAAHLPVVMVSNATVPGLTSLPASLSSQVMITELRNRLHFTGVIMTDSLSAIAISGAHFSLATATVAALHAGADSVLFSAEADTLGATTRSLINAIVTAVNTRVLTLSGLRSDAARIVGLSLPMGCRVAN